MKNSIFILILALCGCKAENSVVEVTVEHKVDESQSAYIKKYQKQKKIIAPELALINADEEPDLKDGFVSLYNGKDLSGWVARGGICEFEAAGEFIRGTCKSRKSPSTFLCTEREDYKDFVFTCEVNWEVSSNSGIMFRSKKRTNGEKEIICGPQCEVEPTEDERGWTGAIYGQNAGGWRYPLWLKAHAEAREAKKKDGTWNRITIQAKGNVFKTWVNGVPAAHYIDTEGFDMGLFGLQVHFGKQGVVLFRNLKIKEL